MVEIFEVVGVVAADASVLAHRLDVCRPGSFRLVLRQADDKERRMHRDEELVLGELRIRDLQQSAVAEEGTE